MLSRLKRRREFLRAAKSGLHASAPGMAVQAYRRPEGDEAASGIRVGFTTSRKVGNAVTRNRVRRRLRAVAEEVLPSLGKERHDYVLVGRSEAKERPFQDLVTDLRSALRHIEHKAAHRRTRAARR